MATVKELRAQAKEQGIEGYSSMSKDELETVVSGEPRSLVETAKAQSPFGLPVGEGSREPTETVQPSPGVNGESSTTQEDQETAYTWKPFVPPEPDDGYGEAAGATRDSAGERSAGIVTRRKAVVGEA